MPASYLQQPTHPPWPGLESSPPPLQGSNPPRPHHSGWQAMLRRCNCNLCTPHEAALSDTKKRHIPSRHLPYSLEPQPLPYPPDLLSTTDTPPKP
ncbi:hypothetical protein AUP68_06965 [Ilyonectria robusta]